ncbi:MAG: efflux RND transporter permease subunit [Acidobacteriota bacterium]|nr:efflux RND transporter permease subunit [Acidobacteriota bacterium]
MNFSRAFINRPVATTLLTLAIALAGAIAFTVLPVSPLPQVDYPTISIGASLPGASAEIMAASVATPLERQLGHIAGVTEMTSSSSMGNTAITLQFDLSRNIDGAARDVQAAINAARTYLPANLPSNPTYRKVNPGDAPIMVLALTSDVYDRGKLYDEASTIVQQKIAQLSGVGQVTTGGGALPSVRVDVDPGQLAHYGLTMSTVQSMLSLQNAHIARGQLANGSQTADIITNDQIRYAADYKPLIVSYKNGTAVRLSDIADVTDSVQNLRSAGYMDGKPSIPIIIFRQPGANIIKTIQTIKNELPSIKASIPRDIELTVAVDRATTIQASLNDVERTLLISIVLVVVVVFIFLRNPRATLVPAVAVPVSLVGTFAVMYLFGYSLDNLSLMALTISTGFVVDDAIVVMENIARHIEGGMKPYHAALQGAKEIGFTVFSISMSLIAVFIPIIMMGGIVGRLFREFAITLSTAILVSMVISLTTTPCMCAHLLKAHQPAQGRIGQASDRFFDRTLGAYRRSLTWVLDNPALMLTVLLLVIALNFVMIYEIPKGFFPVQDTGMMFGGVQGPQDASFPVMKDSVQRIVKVIKSDPAVNHVVAFTGGQGSTNGGFIFMSLKPLNERKAGVMQILGRMRPKLNALPVASAFMQPGQDLRIGGRGGNAMYQYTLQSDSWSELSQWGPVLLAQMRKNPIFQDVNIDQQNGGLDHYLEFDRNSAARLGITTSAFDNALYSAFGQQQVSVIYSQLNQYYVVLEIAPQFLQDPSGLKHVYINASGDGPTPLSAVSKGTTRNIPLSVNHTGLFPSVTISFNLATGVALSDATRAVAKMQAGLNMPPTVRGDFSGTAQAYQTSLSSEPYLILTAILAVYIVLGILYESWMHPITIISTLPSAGIGAMLALMLFHIDLNVISIIGIVLLIGIVKKNAIMMIDFALAAERNEGKSTRDAIFEACMLRFRPILMTTMAAIFGALPLAFGTGIGSELRKPLGITIVGGLIMSQLLTLYTTPVVYLFLDRIRLWLRGTSHDTLPAENGGLPEGAA